MFSKVVMKHMMLLNTFHKLKVGAAKQKVFQALTDEFSSSQPFCCMHVWVQCGPEIETSENLRTPITKRTTIL